MADPVLHGGAAVERAR